jgi:hypothetical protein
MRALRQSRVICDVAFDCVDVRRIYVVRALLTAATHVVTVCFSLWERPMRASVWTVTNRRLASLSFSLLNGRSERHAECGPNCAQTARLKSAVSRRDKALVWLHLALRRGFARRSPSPVRLPRSSDLAAVGSGRPILAARRDNFRDSAAAGGHTNDTLSRCRLIAPAVSWVIKFDADLMRGHDARSCQ